MFSAYNDRLRTASAPRTWFVLIRNASVDCRREAREHNGALATCVAGDQHQSHFLYQISRIHSEGQTREKKSYVVAKWVERLVWRCRSSSHEFESSWLRNSNRHLHVRYSLSVSRILLFETLDLCQLMFVAAREWFTCTSRCSSRTATCPVPTVTSTVVGCSRFLDSDCMHSPETSTKRLKYDSFSTTTISDA